MTRNNKILIGTGAALLLLILSQRNKITKAVKTFTSNMAKTDFIKLFLPYATYVQSVTDVPASVILAQAGLESGWGASVYGNNFFGIKAGPSWKGETQLLKTWECGKTGIAAKDGIKDIVISIFKPGDPAGVCKSGYSYRVYSKFRRYKTVKDGFLDHANFLKTNPRYAKAFNYTHNPKQFAAEVAAAGYATDPDYKNKLHTIIDLINTTV
jgi:flagellum-specific peptidoglycan hydrolase FlgJ